MGKHCKEPNSRDFGAGCKRKYVREHKLTAGVHGSVPKLLTVSDTMQSHAECVYRPPGMSFTNQRRITTEKIQVMKWCSQGVMILRDLGAQANSGCSWMNHVKTIPWDCLHMIDE